MWNSIVSGKSRIFWFDPRQRKVVPMGEGSFGELQIDCSLGLATVQRYEPATKTETGETFDLATGQRLSTVMNRPKRVGRLVITRDVSQNVTTYSDAVTGKVLWQEDTWNRGTVKLKAPLGVPIWVTSKRWLFIIGEDGQPHNDKKGVVDVEPDTRKELKRTHLSDFAMGFAGIVGNPETGSFAVFEASNRGRYCTGVFRSDLTRVPVQFLDVSDITEHGILGREGSVTMTGDPDLNTLVCADAVTGKVMWKSSIKELGVWVGRNVLVGDVLLDGKTGKNLGKLKLPKLIGVGNEGKFVGIEGQSLVGGRIVVR